MEGEEIHVAAKIDGIPKETFEFSDEVVTIVDSSTDSKWKFIPEN